jgi:deoxyribodipyrimidine photo-lyase
VSYNEARVRRLNSARTASGAEYVLYWMQAARRLERNHALDYALASAQRSSPARSSSSRLLRIDIPVGQPVASTRFVLRGQLRENAARAAAAGFAYWPFVETRRGEGRGLLRRLRGARPALVVTDDFPAFIVPASVPRRRKPSRARSRSRSVRDRLENGIVPLARLGDRRVRCGVTCVRGYHKELRGVPGHHRASARPRPTARARAPKRTFENLNERRRRLRGVRRRSSAAVDASVPPVAETLRADRGPAARGCARS